MTSTTDLVRRSDRNPILTPADVPYPVATVHNAAAVRLQDNRIAVVFQIGRASCRERVCQYV